jgi:uncharacterized membrane protein YfcA
MIYASVQRFTANPEKLCGSWSPVKAGIPCGLLGGLLTGAFGTGGPPIVSYLLNRPLDRFTFIASTQMLLALGNGLRSAQFFAKGRLGCDLLPLIVPGILGMLLGAWGGLHCLHRMSEVWLRRLVLGFLLITGVYFLIKAWLIF